MSWPLDLLSALLKFIKTKLALNRLKSQNATVAKVFRDVANTHPNKTALLWEDEAWTFKQLDEYSNRVANFLENEGYKRGDELALFMDGRPEYVALWLGASKAGIITALINTNLKQQSLVHSITVINSKAIIFGNELSEDIQEIIPDLKNKRADLKYYCFGSKEKKILEDGTEFEPLGPKLESASDYYPKCKMMGNFTDKLFYVYTSGTTGLPKAAIIKHCRYFYVGVGCNILVDLTPDDVIYTAIPLYHLAGGGIGTAQCLVFGNTLAIRAKFSASRFWTDCIKYKCTVSVIDIAMITISSTWYSLSVSWFLFPHNSGRSIYRRNLQIPPDSRSQRHWYPTSCQTHVRKRSPLKYLDRFQAKIQHQDYRRILRGYWRKCQRR